MSWIRRWGIIGSIALAQLAIIVGYQALLSPGPVAAYADETVPPPLNGTMPPPVDNSASVTLPRPGEVALSAQGNASPPPVSPCPLPKSNEPPLADLPLLPGKSDAAPPAAGTSPLPGPIPDLTRHDSLVIPAGAKQSPVPGLPGAPASEQPSQSSAGPLAPTPLPGPIPPAPGSGQRGSPPPSPGIPPAIAAGSNEVKPATIPPCPWNLTMEIIEGRTVLTARNGTEVQFKMSCEKLDLQTPHGRMDASGKVKIASEHLDGICEKLTISWHEDVIVLEKVQLKCQLEGSAAEMQAEQLRLRLSRVLATTPSDDCERPPTQQLPSAPR
jgi:hypothetical protein